jgi:hypothetical protein
MTIDAGPTVAAASRNRGDVLWQLAQPSTDADHRRSRLISTGVAGCGIFLLAALAILMIDESANGLTGLAPYVAESGLRGGTALGAALLVVPFVLFGLQALRTGTAARERRLAALSLAGATRPQLRRLAFLEGTRAAVIGALLAGPGYLALWLVFGLLPPNGWKMLPTPGFEVAIGWLVLFVVLAVAGGFAARLSARPATVSPLGMTRRIPRGLGPANAVAPIVSFVLVVFGVTALSSSLGDVGLLIIFPGLAVLAISSGPWLILATGRWAVRQDLLTTMAGRRLLADVRSPGRVVGVLLAVGIAFGVICTILGGMLGEGWTADDLAFYLAGFGAAAVGGLLACVVASSSLVVSATEQVLDGRRGTAVLVALAASPQFVVEVVRRQLLLAAVPAAVIGGLLGWLGAGGLSIASDSGGWVLILALPISLLVSASAAAAGALVAARAVRPAIEETSAPDNLRAP